MNDFIISLRSFQGGIERSHHPGCVSTAYTVLKAVEELDPKFWMYLLKSEAYISVLRSVTDGIREGKNISYEQFGSIILPFPSMREQEEISDFIGRETAKIDALIEEQQGLIALLKEKRQAVISNAVTKGLDPVATYVDSSLFWIGKIPHQWAVKELVELSHPRTQITYGIVQAGPDLEDGVPYIRTTDMSGEHLSRTGYLRTSAEIDESYKRSRVRTGDLVIAIRATVGKALHVPDFLDGANLTQGTAKFSPSEEVDVRYIAYFLNHGATAEFDMYAKGATFKEITLDRLRRVRVCCPPILEQKEIARFLDAEAGAFSGLIAEAKHTIRLLQERRSALISAAVTGKIDLRGYAAAEMGNNAIGAGEA